MLYLTQDGGEKAPAPLIKSHADSSKHFVSTTDFIGVPCHAAHDIIQLQAIFWSN
jgi:hypothetical protein